MALKHEVHESETRTERSEHFSTTIGDWHVFMHVREDGFVTIGMMPEDWRKYESLRLPMFECHPKFVNDLDRLATALPEALRSFAVELRATGKDDLRSEMDKRMDESRRRMDEFMEKLKG